VQRAGRCPVSCVFSLRRVRGLSGSAVKEVRMASCLRRGRLRIFSSRSSTLRLGQRGWMISGGVPFCRDPFMGTSRAAAKRRATSAVRRSFPLKEKEVLLISLHRPNKSRDIIEVQGTGWVFVTMAAISTTVSFSSALPEYLTVEQVATILNVSTDTVARQLGNAEGVIDLGAPETMHKRRKRVLRISRRTLEQFIASRQVRRR
jgi:hypothetical protein